MSQASTTAQTGHDVHVDGAFTAWLRRCSDMTCRVGGHGEQIWLDQGVNVTVSQSKIISLKGAVGGKERVEVLLVGFEVSTGYTKYMV